MRAITALVSRNFPGPTAFCALLVTAVATNTVCAQAPPWTDVTAPSPTWRWGPIVFDTARNKTIVFDGFSHTFEWDGASWIQYTIGGSPPPARSTFAIAYDSN